MRLLRRILLALAIILAVVFVTMHWIVPVALSFYAAHKAPAIARVVPIDLKDHTISTITGKSLSYLGYQFEVPWTDVDETQTKLYPTDKPVKTMVDLRFRSGLRLLMSSIPPRSLVNDLPKNMNVTPQAIESAFGRETMKSDYSFVKTVYDFTPDKMNHWSFGGSGMNRDESLLIFKSIIPAKSAETGIFNLQSPGYQGFQQGSAELKQDRIILDLYSDEGSVEMIFFEKDYKNPAGVTQPEINRIVQSLRRASQNPSNEPQIEEVKVQ